MHKPSEIPIYWDKLFRAGLDAFEFGRVWIPTLVHYMIVPPSSPMLSSISTRSSCWWSIYACFSHTLPDNEQAEYERNTSSFPISSFLISSWEGFECSCNTWRPSCLPAETHIRESEWCRENISRREVELGRAHRWTVRKFPRDVPLLKFSVLEGFGGEDQVMRRELGGYSGSLVSCWVPVPGLRWARSLISFSVIRISEGSDDLGCPFVF